MRREIVPPMECQAKTTNIWRRRKMKYLTSSSEDEDEKGDSATNGVSSKDHQHLEEEEDEISDEESGEEESGDEEEGPGLAALYTNSNLEDSDDSDFTEDGAAPEDDEVSDDESDEDLEITRGKKRKHEEEENV